MKIKESLKDRLFNTLLSIKNFIRVKLKFNTQKFQAPSLVFREVSIKDLAGNNNNIIENI